MISINTQAYEYMFFNINGDKVSASSLRDENWASWTRKFGWPVQGIFQGVDYTDVNSVCRDPSGNYLAVGYDDQTIRLFRYPCYIPKQISKQYYGHSSHITKIRFSPNHLISVGGLDRTIIVWDI
jgi:WD40 repeat protein